MKQNCNNVFSFEVSTFLFHVATYEYVLRGIVKKILALVDVSCEYTAA